MLERTVTLPQIAAVAVTRAALGAGIGLLAADHLDKDHRRRLGWSLVALGVLTTFPLACGIICGKHCSSHRSTAEGAK